MTEDRATEREQLIREQLIRDMGQEIIQLRAIEAAARVALATYDAVLPYIKAGDVMNHIHGGRYGGPDGGLPAGMEPLRAALDAKT